MAWSPSPSCTTLDDSQAFNRSTGNANNAAMVLMWWPCFCNRFATITRSCLLICRPLRRFNSAAFNSHRFFGRPTRMIAITIAVPTCLYACTRCQPSITTYSLPRLTSSIGGNVSPARNASTYRATVCQLDWTRG